MVYRNIIVSGLPGAGKSTLAKELARIYRWEHYSAGRIFKERWREEYPNQEISFDHYWHNCPIEENKKVDEQTRRALEKGCIVGDFRYAILAQDIEALRIGVTADLETRAERNNSIVENDPFRIKEVLRRREEDEVRVGKELYGREYDYRDPIHYHIVLNSARLTLNQEIGLIQRLMRQVGRAGLEPAIDTV